TGMIGVFFFQGSSSGSQCTIPVELYRAYIQVVSLIRPLFQVMVQVGLCIADHGINANIQRPCLLQTVTEFDDLSVNTCIIDRGKPIAEGSLLGVKQSLDLFLMLQGRSSGIYKRHGIIYKDPGKSTVLHLDLSALYSGGSGNPGSIEGRLIGQHRMSVDPGNGYRGIGKQVVQGVFCWKGLVLPVILVPATSYDELG